MAKLNGTVKWATLLTVVVLAALGGAWGYGALDKQVNVNTTNIAEMKPVLTKLLDGQARIEEIVKGLRE